MTDSTLLTGAKRVLELLAAGDVALAESVLADYVGGAEQMDGVPSSTSVSISYFGEANESAEAQLTAMFDYTVRAKWLGQEWADFKVRGVSRGEDDGFAYVRMCPADSDGFAIPGAKAHVIDIYTDEFEMVVY
jgi:hypothetical protein